MSAATFAGTPPPPYYAVIFCSTRTAGDRGYGDTADRMAELASAQPGWYLHYEVRIARVERAYGKPPDR